LNSFIPGYKTVEMYVEMHSAYVDSNVMTLV